MTLDQLKKDIAALPETEIDRAQLQQLAMLNATLKALHKEVDSIRVLLLVFFVLFVLGAVVAVFLLVEGA